MKKIIIWGAGAKLRSVLNCIVKEQCIISAIVDTNEKKNGEMICNYRVTTPKLADFQSADYVVISTVCTKNIERDCIIRGIDTSKIIKFWTDEREFEFIDSVYRRFELLLIEQARLQRKYDNVRYELGVEVTPNIISAITLLEEIIQEKASLCRFGDGEFEIMNGKNRPWFQQFDEELAQRLYEIINETNSDLKIAIADNYGSLEQYSEYAADTIRSYMNYDVRQEHYKIIDLNRAYYDAYVSRPYIMYKDKFYADKIFNLWKSVWENRDVMIIEGKNSRFGIGNNLLSNAKSIARIECPEKDAYKAYWEIYDYARREMKEGNLVLISLGPTATVLAYDLFKLGFQAIDIGQLDNEYDWYLSQASERRQIEGKCTAEVPEGTIPTGDIDLADYYKQVVAIITVPKV